MASIFNLTTNANQLKSSNDGTTRAVWEQVSATRNIQGPNFAEGRIAFPFQLFGTRWWMPNRTFLRIRCSLKRANGAPLLTEDDISPTFNLAPCLFSQCEFAISGKPVSTIHDNLEIIDTLKTRLSKSNAWIDTVGKTTCFFDDDFASRQAEVCADGVNAYAVGPSTSVTHVKLGLDTATCSLDATTGVVTITPPAPAGDAAPAVLDIRNLFKVNIDYIRFESIHGTPPATDDRTFVPLRVIELLDHHQMRVDLTNYPMPRENITGSDQHVYERLRIDTRQVTDQPARAGEFELIWTPPLPVFDLPHALCSGDYQLSLQPKVMSKLQTSVVESLHANKIPGNDYVFSVESMYLHVFTVEGPRPPNNQVFMLDLQDNIRIQAETLRNPNASQKHFSVPPSTNKLSTLFSDTRVDNDTRFSKTIFRAYDPVTNEETSRKLRRYSLTYDGVAYPQPSIDMHNRLGTDLGFKEMLVRSMYHSGAMQDPAGSETLPCHYKRGLFFHTAVYRDGVSGSREVVVSTEFDPSCDVSHTRLLLAAHYSQVVKCTVAQGKVIDVQVMDA